MNCSILLTFLVSILCSTFVCAANETSNRTCGINSVYAALALEDIKVDWLRLTDEKYLRANEGSQMNELIAAVIDSGGYAIGLENLTLDSIRQLQHPAILNVKRDLGRKAYDHWLVLLPATDSKKLRIFDSPQRLVEVQESELLARWNGAAILVARVPLDVTASKVLRNQRLRGLRYFAPAALLYAASLVVSNRRGKTGSLFLIKGMLVLIGVACVSAFAYHVFSTSGFLGESGPINSIQTSRITEFIPEVGVEEVETGLGKSAKIIDARWPTDFKLGSIPGAINMPPGSHKEQREALLAGVDREHPIIIYCQSPTCTYAEEAARVLHADGFTSISLFREGWIGWIEAGKGTDSQKE